MPLLGCIIAPVTNVKASISHELAPGQQITAKKFAAQDILQMSQGGTTLQNLANDGILPARNLSLLNDGGGHGERVNKDTPALSPRFYLFGKADRW